MTFNDIANAIMVGQLDENLDAIQSVIKERREAKARVTFFSLRPGDKARFVANVRPAYFVA